jgi:hypothetical protein
LRGEARCLHGWWNVERARIVLRAAEGLENRQIAAQMSVMPEKVAIALCPTRRAKFRLWIAKAADILEKVKRARATLNPQSAYGTTPGSCRTILERTTDRIGTVTPESSTQFAKPII